MTHSSLATRKIDIYINGKYEVSTNRHSTCIQALAAYKSTYKTEVFSPDEKITAHFAK